MAFPFCIRCTLLLLFRVLAGTLELLPFDDETLVVLTLFPALLPAPGVLLLGRLTLIVVTVLLIVPVRSGLAGGRLGRPGRTNSQTVKP